MQWPLTEQRGMRGGGKGWQDNEEEERQRRCSAVMSGSEKQLVWIS